MHIQIAKTTHQYAMGTKHELTVIQATLLVSVAQREVMSPESPEMVIYIWFWHVNHDQTWSRTHVLESSVHDN